MARAPAVVLVLAGCRFGFDPTAAGLTHDATDDGGGGGGGGGDGMSAVCDLAAPFGAPVLVPGLNDPSSDDGTFRAMPDELSGYYWSARGGNTDIYYATRPDMVTAFTVAKLAPVNSPSLDLDPTITADGLTLVFRSDRPGGAGGNDLYRSTRATLASTFGAPTAIGSLDTAQSEVEPSFDATAGELYFSSNRSGDYAIWSSVHTGATFQAPTRIVELDSIGNADEDAALSNDALTIYFRSNRPGGTGGYDIWSASRATTAAPFGTPALVPNVNSTSDEGPSWLSPDGCRMYVSSNRGGTNDVYVASRP